jgi:hypothetical protein
VDIQSHHAPFAFKKNAINAVAMDGQANALPAKAKAELWSPKICKHFRGMPIQASWCLLVSTMSHWNE